MTNQSIFLDMAMKNIIDCEICETPTPKQLLKEVKIDNENLLMCRECLAKFEDMRYAERQENFCN